jgi:hypothetical protein
VRKGFAFPMHVELNFARLRLAVAGRMPALPGLEISF